MKSFTSVEEYIRSAPGEIQDKLKILRTVIRETIPKAKEKISYGMPYYSYNGRLAYFRLQANHIGLYIPPPVIREHKKELHKYGTSTATVRFPLDDKLPVALIKKLVKSRMKKNDEAKR